MQVLLLVLLGLGSGALIAGIAVGVVVTYRGSGIINLALGGYAMLAGYAFWALNTGELGFTLSKAPALIARARLRDGRRRGSRARHLPAAAQHARRWQGSSPPWACC